MKPINIISLFLGITSFMFGILKFINPFREWVGIQIAKSGLPPLAFPVAIAGEVAIGLFFLLPFIINRLFKYKLLLFILANIILIIMMAVAVYVHFQPDVSAEVLPLKIKEPYIPIANILFAGTNLFLIMKYIRNENFH